MRICRYLLYYDQHTAGREGVIFFSEPPEALVTATQRGMDPSCVPPTLRSRRLVLVTAAADPKIS